MPEGPEHFKAAAFINKHCQDRSFTGKIVKSEVNHRNPEIDCQYETYTVSAKARGKEVMVTVTNLTLDEKKQQSIKKKGIVKLEPVENKSEHFSIVFRFGMSGCFRFTDADNLPKHSHLRFFSIDGMVLSFEDVRRFGKWKLTDTFSADRGPDPVYEYIDFRKNVLNNIKNRIFQKSICELLHNQKYFNGIGNYLRAEILYRCKIPPFTKSFDVFENLAIEKEEPKRKAKGNDGDFDILEYCSLVPFEVMVLEGGGYDKSEKDSDYSLFENWLQCYYNKDMNNLVDHDGRTMWFQGEPGPLVPTGEKAKARHNAKVIVPTEDNKKKTKEKSKKNTKKKAESKRSLTKGHVQPKKKLAHGRKKGNIKKEENADLVEECDNKDSSKTPTSLKSTKKKGPGNRKRSIKHERGKIEATDVEVKDEKVIKIDDSHLRRSSRLKK
eukprot:TCONS_00058495-protein